jgi:hypothetical protein
VCLTGDKKCVEKFDVEISLKKRPFGRPRIKRDRIRGLHAGVRVFRRI